MYAQVEEPKENESRAVANSFTQKKSDMKQGFGFEDNRSEVIVQRKLKKVIDNCPKVNHPKSFHARRNGNNSIGESLRNHLVQRVITNPKYNAPCASSVDIQAPLATGQSPGKCNLPGWCLDAEAVHNPSNHGQMKPHHHERGHLIGSQFGGVGTQNNLVTMTDKTNGHDMLAEENTIVRIINSNPGTVYTYTVTPTYNTNFKYSHLGNVDPTLKNHVYCCHPAPESIKMDLRPQAGGESVHNKSVDNAEMYAQHLY